MTEKDHNRGGDNNNNKARDFISDEAWASISEEFPMYADPRFRAKLERSIQQHQELKAMAVKRGLMRRGQLLPDALTVGWLLGGYGKAIAAMDFIEGRRKQREIDEEDGTPLGEIIRSAGVAMKNALGLPPSDNRTTILEATANILNQAERLAPDDDGLSDWSKHRELVAAM